MVYNQGQNTINMELFIRADTALQQADPCLCQTFIHEAVAAGSHDGPPLPPPPGPQLAPDNYRDLCTANNSIRRRLIPLDLARILLTLTFGHGLRRFGRKGFLQANRPNWVLSLAVSKCSPYCLWDPSFLQVVRGLDLRFIKRNDFL